MDDFMQGMAGRERGQLLREADSTAGAPQRQQEQYLMGRARKCPVCGADNDADSSYCATCGALMQRSLCPNCGAEMDLDADFCESCHQYIRKDVCSFCGAKVADQDAFCPECGAPRGGIVCPTCHTLNDFSFCKSCGTPLTDEARHLVAELKQQPDYQQLVLFARKYNELQMQLPCDSERDKARVDASEKLRQRVLMLLAKDEGIENPVVPKPDNERLSKAELDAQKRSVGARITELLERMALPPQPKPAIVRNYAMAQKPVGVRLAWVCNYKNAMHSSPCGCAKPQLGGKWVILGHGSKEEIKDDK